MDQQVADTEVSTKARGRKDNSGTEVVIEAGVVGKRVSELIGLYQSAVAAKGRYADAIKATAEKSGLLSTVVAKYVKARATDKVEDRKREVQQLSLLFDEVGEG